MLTTLLSLLVLAACKDNVVELTSTPAAKPVEAGWAFYDVTLADDPKARFTLGVNPSTSVAPKTVAEVRLLAKTPDAAKRVVDVLWRCSGAKAGDAEETPKDARALRAIRNVGRRGPRASDEPIGTLDPAFLTVIFGDHQFYLTLPTGTGVKPGYAYLSSRIPSAPLVSEIQSVLMSSGATPAPTLSRLDGVERFAGPGTFFVSAGNGWMIFSEPAKTGWNGGVLTRSGAVRVLGSTAGMLTAGSCITEPALTCAVVEHAPDDHFRGWLFQGDKLTEFPLPPDSHFTVLDLERATIWPSPDGRYIASSRGDNRVWALDRKTGKHVIGKDPAAQRALKLSSWDAAGGKLVLRDFEQSYVFDLAASTLTKGGLVAGDTHQQELWTADKKLRLVSIGGTATLTEYPAEKRVELPLPPSVNVFTTTDKGFWLSPTVALLHYDPLVAVDVQRRLVEPVVTDRLQLSGGAIDGNKVWLERSDGFFRASVQPR